MLDRLLADGLVATVQKGARACVIPQDPIALLKHIEAQRQFVQEVLRRLRSIPSCSG